MDEIEEDKPWDSEIKGRQRLFVLNYCTNPLFFMNGRRSYIEAYTKIKDNNELERPSNEVADVNASRLLSNAKVKRAVSQLLAESQPEADKDNSYKLLHDLVIQATFNPSDIIDNMGNLKGDLEDLGDLAKCIESIEPTKFGPRVRLTSRKFAQDKLLKYYELVREQPEIQATLPVIYMTDKEDEETWNKDEASGTLETAAKTEASS